MVQVKLDACRENDSAGLDPARKLIRIDYFVTYCTNDFRDCYHVNSQK